jgi:hypothetical protein
MVTFMSRSIHILPCGEGPRGVDKSRHKYIMRDPINNDNKYPMGMTVFAKAHPTIQLIIDAYKQRIYFCAVVGHPEMSQLAYYERELVDPNERTMLSKQIV